MLKQLSIKNFLLIKNINFTFHDGLCVLTGETGAGKSMILDSLNLISGERAKNSYKPAKGKITNITALFNVEHFPNIKIKLENQGIEYTDEIIIKRVINDDGKSKSFINDNLVSLNIIKEITRDLIEIQSQFSEQGLLDSSTHISSLDEYGDYKKELDTLSRLWKKLEKSRNDFEILKNENDTLIREKENISFDINELEKLNPISDEVIELSNKKKRIQNFEKINESINQITSNFISEEPPGIEFLLSKNLKILNKIDDLLDDKQKKIINSLESIFIEIGEISKFYTELSRNPSLSESLDSIEERLFFYKKLSRKHGVNENSLPELLANLKKKISITKNYEENINKYKHIMEENKNSYLLQAEKISSLRKKFAVEMDTKINSEFPALKLESAQFETFLDESIISEIGKDKVSFKIKTNPKSEMSEIKNVSSGGELCRIALAIKVISQKNNKSQIVFDEVDSGIGGAVSTAVGERLRRLGDSRQVLVVTHSPQVAVLANDHYLVKKNNKDINVEISIKKLAYNEKITEIARMLSGKQITKEAQIAAKKLLDSHS